MFELLMIRKVFFCEYDDDDIYKYKSFLFKFKKNVYNENIIESSIEISGNWTNGKNAI